MNPILTIAIPTFKRAAYLKITLDALLAELNTVPAGTVEIVVSDNASPDQTATVVEGAIAAGGPIRSFRNSENIGSDANIAQVFNLSKASYVLILGDDDVLTAGTLSFLVETIQQYEYGVIFLRPYGYDENWTLEYPGGTGKTVTFSDSKKFLSAINAYMTLISACVINKRLLGAIDARTYCGGKLVQTHLVIAAALKASRNLYQQRYSVACKRNNSGGYSFSEVFVNNLGAILVNSGLSAIAIKSIETRMILGFYPYYLLQQRRNNSDEITKARSNFRTRYSNRLLFWIWLAPTLIFPKQLAIVWGALTVFIGRILVGDFWRGWAFLNSRLRRALGGGK